MNSCDIKINTITKESLISSLNEYNKYFTPELSSYIDNFEEYADKIIKNADIIEAYNSSGILVGLLCIYLNQEFGYITHFAVKPEFQNHGIGLKLLEAAENLAFEKNINLIRLECFISNKQGLNFYIKHSFKVIKGEQKKYLLEKILKHKNTPMVSICCVTYNHEKYIRQCLDGFMMQKTNFKFEVLIHDDASTDGTANIIREYEQKYPDIIKPIYQIENQFSTGKIIFATYNAPRIKGKYAAMCEGDDYWTDPYKLQKQFDFMEANPDYTVCTHIVKITHEPPILPDSVIPQDAYERDYTNVSLKDVLTYAYFHTSSCFFRWNILNNIEDSIKYGFGSRYVLALFAKYGKVKFIPEEMSVYRQNPNGIYAGSASYAGDYSIFISKFGFFRLKQEKAVYHNIASDKEWYFKEVYYPLFTNYQYMLLKRKRWKTFFDITYQNAHIYLLLLKHWRVMPYLIWQDTYKLLKKLYKVITKKSN